LLDPELTITQPARITSLTGIDALSHALETFVTSRNPVSLAFSHEAWRLLAGNFARVAENPQDLEARGSMLLNASFAGLTIGTRCWARRGWRTADDKFWRAARQAMA
jgi:alcohol dehydrogenase